MADHGRSGSIEAMCLFFIVLSILVTLLRMISRIQSAAGLWWDDWFNLAALVFVVVLNILEYIESKHGLGQHNTSTNPIDLGFLLHLLYFENLVYNVCLSFVKLSILCFYQRIFATTRKTKQLLWITAGLTAAWFISNTLVVLFGCSPIRAAWDTSIKGKCMNKWEIYLGSAVTSILLDLILLFIPAPFLWRLHMGASQKTALSITFLLGYLNPIISIVRLVYLIELGPKWEDPDITWKATNLAISTTAECSVALISACVPSLHPLFLRVLKTLPGLKLLRELTHRRKSGKHNMDTSTKQGLAHQGGSFARLKDERANLGLARTQSNYEVSAYKTYGVTGEEMELDSQKSAVDEIGQILVSRSVSVISYAGSEGPRDWVGYI